MAKIILHTNLSVDAINDLRLLEDFTLSHKQRMDKAFKLMKMAMLFSNKKTVHKAILLKNV
jgi:hypothetical protein